ncbi:MAG: hypothetical protein ACRDOA_09875 [Streptosporangiaceae bacterium]
MAASRPAAAKAASASASVRAARRPTRLTAASSSIDAACTASTCPPSATTPGSGAAAVSAAWIRCRVPSTAATRHVRRLGRRPVASQITGPGSKISAAP